MKKTIMLMLATALMSLCAQAQNATKARQVLDKTAAIVGNKGGASANFTIKGNKFTATTPEATMWYDGKTQ